MNVRIILGGCFIWGSMLALAANSARASSEVGDALASETTTAAVISTGFSPPERVKMLKGAQFRTGKGKNKVVHVGMLSISEGHTGAYPSMSGTRAVEIVDRLVPSKELMINLQAAGIRVMDRNGPLFLKRGRSRDEVFKGVNHWNRLRCLHHASKSGC